MSSELPPFKPLQMPNYLFFADALVQLPVEKLTDAQALAFWRSQEVAFLEHVRKRRKAPPERMSTPKRWGR